MPRTTHMLVVAAALAAAAVGCDRREPTPGGGSGETPAAEPTASPAEPTASPAEPVPLSPELTAIARMIGDRKTELARARLETHLETHPDDGQAAFLLGLTYHREKRYALAEPWFASAVELAPGYHTVHHFHGWCLYYLGDMAGARAAFERHLAAAPGEGDSHFALGLVALDEDRLDDAARRFRRAIELQEHNPGRRRDVSKAHARMADVHIRRDELEAARAELELATRLWPQHYTAFYKLSRVLNRLGDTAAADEAFRRYRIWEARAAQRRGVPESSS